VIERVVPESPVAQDSPAKEQLQQQEDHNDTDYENDEEYPPLRDTEVERMYRDADEVESLGAEALVPTDRLRSMMGHLGITTAPRYKIKVVPRLGWVEFKTILEIILKSRILCRHLGPTCRASCSDTVADATWEAITLWVHSNKGRLHNSIHLLLPYQKKDQLKAYGVKKDVPRMEMVHHQDVIVELSTHLLAAQCEIETLRKQFWNSDATIRGYMRMPDGQASDLYPSDPNTWSATSTI
jgi:hypothetical protein